MAGGAQVVNQRVNLPTSTAGSGAAGNRLGGNAAQPAARVLSVQDRAGVMPAAVTYQGRRVSVFDDPAAYVAGHGLTFTDPDMASYVTPQQATELVAEMVAAMGRMAASAQRLVSTTVHATSPSAPDYRGTTAQRNASVHRRVSATFARNYSGQ